MSCDADITERDKIRRPRLSGLLAGRCALENDRKVPIDRFPIQRWPLISHESFTPLGMTICTSRSITISYCEWSFECLLLEDRREEWRDSRQSWACEVSYTAG